MPKTSYLILLFYYHIIVINPVQSQELDHIVLDIDTSVSATGCWSLFLDYIPQNWPDSLESVPTPYSLPSFIILDEKNTNYTSIPNTNIIAGHRSVYYPLEYKPIPFRYWTMLDNGDIFIGSYSTAGFEMRLTVKNKNLMKGVFLSFGPSDSGQHLMRKEWRSFVSLRRLMC